MADWRMAEFKDGIRPRMFAACAAGLPFALATIVHASGGPRRGGGQMVVTGEAAHGFQSDGCTVANVGLHAR